MKAPSLRRGPKEPPEDPDQKTMRMRKPGTATQRVSSV